MVLPDPEVGIGDVGDLHGVENDGPEAQGQDLATATLPEGFGWPCRPAAPGVGDRILEEGKAVGADIPK